MPKIMPDELNPTWPGTVVETLGVVALVLILLFLPKIFAGLAPLHAGLPLIAQAIALFFATACLMIACRTASGGHLNPLMTFLYGLEDRLPLGQALAMSSAHLVGALAAMLLAFAYWPEPSANTVNEAHLIGEWLATMLVVSVIVSFRNADLIDAGLAIGAAMAAVYWVSGGTTLVNPAVTLVQGIFGIGLNATQAGPIMAAQFAGALTGLQLARMIWGYRI
jgi:glycerol uptake facilitator-like aquaporin